MQIFNKNSRIPKIALGVGLPVLVTFGLSAATFAASAYSSVGDYGPIDGISYANESLIQVGSSSSDPVWTNAYVWAQNDAYVPAGWVGADARLYNSSGAEVYNSGMSYCDSSLSNGADFQVDAEDYVGTGNYYAQGVTASWNGNGYDDYWTFKTPTFSTPDSVTAPITSTFSVNASGQTYGSDLSVASSAQGPTLVEVVATNGKTGYAYANQLNGPTPTSPAQAVALGKTGPRTVPVYKSNGTTVIGHFIVGQGTITKKVSHAAPQG